MGRESRSGAQQGHAHTVLIDPESGIRCGAAASRTFGARSLRTASYP